MRRRDFIKAIGNTGVSLCAGAIASVLFREAFAQGRQVRIGFLASVQPTADILGALRDGLRERGYIEGRNLILDVRWPQDTLLPDRGLASELVQRNSGVIIAWTTPSAIAARQATTTIPIVMVGVADPVGVGLIASLARPGGNITGISNMAADLSAKLMELLMEIVPGMTRVGVILNPKNPGAVIQIQGTQEAVRAMGLQFQTIEAATPAEFERAFARLRGDGVKAVVLLADSSVIEHRKRIAELARDAGLLTATQRREYVEAGGVLSYGPNLARQIRETASYVHRIIEGAKPADLPVAQPTTFELVINVKSAKGIGIDVPPTLLARADEVIE